MNQYQILSPPESSGKPQLNDDSSCNIFNTEFPHQFPSSQMSDCLCARPQLHLDKYSIDTSKFVRYQMTNYDLEIVSEKNPAFLLRVQKHSDQAIDTAAVARHLYSGGVSILKLRELPNMF